jgi:acetylornithine deacetylase/succinyl-diaminopimelate desuccinylase-like protein
MPALSLADFERDALATLSRYAEVPCVSPIFDPEWVEHGFIDDAAQMLAAWARERSFARADVTIHALAGRTPVLVVTIDATTSSGDATALLYGHLDKQPPLGDWSEGLGPFTPVRRGNRLYARGVADDGYSAFAALLAIEAMERDGIPHGRCVVLIEASEESGSPDLEAYLDELAPQLGRVELMICLDSGALTYDRLWVTTSLRGMVHAEVTVKVLEHGQHSGAASGVVPSSFRILRQLLDRVEDARTGDVLLPELRCEIPAQYVLDAKAVAEEFGDVLALEMPTVPGLTLMGSSSEDRILRKTWSPTLSIVGMGGIPQPIDAGNVLRPSTTAVLSFRLPPTVDADGAAAAIRRALTSDVPSSASVTVEIVAADGWLTPTLAPWLSDALDAASMDAFGRGPGFAGEGGSIPFLASLGKRYPQVQFVATGALGPHSNAHAIDEMLDLTAAVGVTNAVVTILGAFARETAG